MNFPTRRKNGSWCAVSHRIFETKRNLYGNYIQLKANARHLLGSRLLRQLDRHAHLLDGVECHSFYTFTDITVCPGWRAVLPMGPSQALPVLTHRQLILHPRAIRRLVEVLLAP